MQRYLLVSCFSCLYVDILSTGKFDDDDCTLVGYKIASLVALNFISGQFHKFILKELKIREWGNLARRLGRGGIMAHLCR